MALKGLCIGLMAALAAAVLWKGGSAQSSTCTSVLVSLYPCLTYITGNATAPSSSCCQQLAVVVQSQPQCLCMVLNGSASSSIGIAVNETQAMALPGACNVQTPPASRCNTSAGPTASPTARPASSPSVPGTPSGAGSITLPTGTSYGMATQLPLTLTFFLVFVAVYLSSPPTTI